jgi:hypothetical protein
MMVVLLIAGIGFLLAGLLTIGFGIPVKEFSFGNTLILTGTVAACTGMIMLGLWMVVRELRSIARRLGPAVATEDQSLLFSRDELAAENAGNAQPSAPSPPPWREDAASRDRVRSDMPSAPESVETAPAAKPRRNLLFSSSSRRERERAQAASADAASAERQMPAPRKEDQPPVTVLKSGVVDGMAYSLYSDGSIEAQMPEGMMRFASIDELRAHLDQRP